MLTTFTLNAGFAIAKGSDAATGSPVAALSEPVSDPSVRHGNGGTSSGGVIQAYPLGTEEQSGAIGDFIWYDAHIDGIQDAYEPGIANVTMVLYRDEDDNGPDPGEMLVLE